MTTDKITERETNLTRDNLIKAMRAGAWALDGPSGDAGWDADTRKKWEVAQEVLRMAADQLESDGKRIGRAEGLVGHVAALEKVLGK